MLGRMVDPRWFDAGAVAEAGNVAPHQMQSGFQLLRPTAEPRQGGHARRQGARPGLPRLAYEALEAWASDNVAFPAAAYRTYIGELYQENRLVKGEHAVAGKRVSLEGHHLPGA